MRVLPFTRGILKYLGILPFNKKFFIPMTALYCTVYYPTLKFLVPNISDLIVSSQGVYLLLVITTTISDNLNFMLLRSKLVEIFAFTEILIEKCKFG